MALWIIFGLIVGLACALALKFAIQLSEARNFMTLFGSQAAVDRKMRELGKNCFDAFCYMQRAKNVDERKARSREFVCHRDIFEYAIKIAIKQGRRTPYTWGNCLTRDEQRIMQSLPQ